jgi:hypothetical protein
VPEDFLIGRVIGEDIIDPSSGEILANANDEITENLLAKLVESGVTSLHTLYITTLTVVASFRRPCALTKRSLGRPHALPFTG